MVLSEDMIERYKKLKIEYYTYIEGIGNKGLIQKHKIYCRHLEDMIFGKDIDINDDTYL